MLSRNKIDETLKKMEDSTKIIEKMSLAMSYKLKVNAYKPHWLEMDLEECFELLLEEVEELNEELDLFIDGESSVEKLQMEAADVANFAQFIVEKARSNEKTTN